MSPSHRADLPGDQPPDQPVPPVPGQTDDPDGSAPAPPDSGELDVLVDRLAAEQAQQAQHAQQAEQEEDTAAAAPSAAPAGAVPPADELATLLTILDGQREAVARKVEGLDDGQASSRMVGSATTLTGIVRHLADTERHWFREVIGGLPRAEAGYRWFDEHDADAEWRLEPGASLDRALADYQEACELSRAQIVGRDGDEEVWGPREVRTVRWVVAHMIAETSRHLGHLDVLAELLDGRTGT